MSRHQGVSQDGLRMPRTASWKSLRVCPACVNHTSVAHTRASGENGWGRYDGALVIASPHVPSYPNELMRTVDAWSFVKVRALTEGLVIQPHGAGTRKPAAPGVMVTIDPDGF